MRPAKSPDATFGQEKRQREREANLVGLWRPPCFGHMAVAGEDPVAAAETAGERACLGRRLDDDDPHRPATPAPGRPSPPGPRRSRRRRAPRRVCARWRVSLEGFASMSRLPAPQGVSASCRTASTNRMRAKMEMPIASQSIRNAHSGASADRQARRRHPDPDLRNVRISGRRAFSFAHSFDRAESQAALHRAQRDTIRHEVFCGFPLPHPSAG